MVAVSRERGDIFRLRAGALEEVENLSEYQPRRHDQGGLVAGALSASHRQPCARAPTRGSRAPGLDRSPRARSASDCRRNGRDMGRVLTELLSQRVGHAVIGRDHAPRPMRLPPSSSRSRLPVLEQWRATEERATIERWREEVGRGGRASGGLGGRRSRLRRTVASRLAPGQDREPSRRVALPSLRPTGCEGREVSARRHSARGAARTASTSSCTRR